MKIVILGTRGVPNYHGGFEQFAEYFAEYLVKNNHEVYVYSSSNHPYKEKTYKGVNIIHCYDPENLIGTAGQFIYDFNCILDSRKRDFDIILQLGYTSSSIWHRILPKKSIIITNMDGLEWKRSKYNKYVRRFLKYAEKLGVESSDFLISDSVGIQEYINETYNRESTYIAYGAHIFDNPKEEVLKEYSLLKHNYNMLIARLEPENNIEIILDGIVKSESDLDFLVIGKHESNFGEYLKQKYKDVKKIRFLGGIYNQENLNNLRFFSNIYFHGHSVGGTNPSLLEAMASNSFIIANENIFNRSILDDNAFYFEDSSEVKMHLDTKKKRDYPEFVARNKQKILNEFTWKNINSKYETHLMKCLEK